MKEAATHVVSTKRLTVRRSAATNAADELAVECPMTDGEVLLRRCAFCEHGQGLLLDPSTSGLALRCSFTESARAKRLLEPRSTSYLRED